MAYSIDGDCILCGMCAEMCPVGAIHGEDEPGSIDRYRYAIDEEACVDCGECSKVCPAQAIAVLE
jgi:ferredoxin